MKKSLKNKLIGTVAGASLIGLTSLAGCITPTPQGDAFINYMGHVVAQTFITEEIKKEMGHSDYQQQQGNVNVNVSVPQLQDQQSGKSNYEKYQKLPLVFLFLKYDERYSNPNKRYVGLGTQIIYPGQTFEVIGKYEIFKMGKEVVNQNICLTDGEIGKIIKKKNIGMNNRCLFDPAPVFEDMREKGLSVRVWKNTWYVDGKEVGRVTYALVDPSMYSKNQGEESGVGGKGEISGVEEGFKGISHREEITKLGHEEVGRSTSPPKNK